MDNSGLSSNLIAVQRSHVAAQHLAIASQKERRQSVMILAKAMKAHFNDILEANTIDLEMSREMAVSDVISDWLKLTPERLVSAISILHQLGKTTSPIQKLLKKSYQPELAQSYSRAEPLGTIALIYESFPELSAIVAGMCIKTGNSLILRGCSTASHTNQIITQIIKTALTESPVPKESVEIISPDSGASIQELIGQEQQLDLIIPYGRPSLVQQVLEQATVPVISTAIGNCYLYWASSANLELTQKMVVSSHQGKPDAANAIEKILVQDSVKPSNITSMFKYLQEKGFSLRGDVKMVNDFSEYLQPLNTTEWVKPYMKKIVAFRYVENLPEAVNWINSYSSGHADCLATESYQESRQFANSVKSALVFVNASPRFDRHPDQGESIFLGMSNQKGSNQGLIGLENLTTIKQIIQG